MKHRLAEIIPDFKDKKILVIGDIMLDKFVLGEVKRLSQEAPVQIVDVKEEYCLPGGAANVAANLAALGAKITLFGLAGPDEGKNQLFDELKRRGISTSKVIISKNRPTTIKTRVIVQNYQLLRMDKEDKCKIDNSTEKRIMVGILKKIKETDAVVISDYNKGAITESLSIKIIDLCKKHNKPIVVDPKPENISFYKGTYLIKPNVKDITSLMKSVPKTEEELENIGRKMVFTLNSNILITRGENGMSLFEKNGNISHIPTEAKEVFDIVGAGDTVTATLALAIAAKATLYEATIMANYAAGIVVGKFGTSTVSQNELISLFEKGNKKIKDISELKEIVKELKLNGRKVVWTNGCFDILHAGHTKYLQEARRLGDALILGLNTDASIRRIKGKNRPIIPENERAEMLSAIECVDYVIFFDEDTPLNVIKSIMPNIIVKGGDYKVEDVVGKDVVEKQGGEVIIIPLKGEISTTKIINNIINNHFNAK